MFSQFANNEIEKTATSIFIYTFNLIQDNSSWEALIQYLNNLSEETKKISENDASWFINTFPDFYFMARKIGSTFSLSVLGSSNGTSKKYFGFTLFIPQGLEKAWNLRLDDANFGFKATNNAKIFSKSMKNVISQSGLNAVTLINGKRSFWESLIE